MAAAIPIMVALTAASTVHQVESTRQAKREGDRAQKYAREDMARAEKDLADRKAAEQAEADQLNKRDADRIRARTGPRRMAGGRQATLLTGPLGITDGPTQGGKTLLGS